MTDSNSKWVLWKTRRHLLVCLVVLGMGTFYIFRLNMSVAIVVMTQNRYVYLDNGTRLNLGREFQWDNVMQGYVLSGFFYGYIFTPVLGGIIARKMGGKITFGFSMTCTALLSIICPWVAEWNVYALIVLRVLTGFLEGVSIPGLYCLWANWIPETEKARTSNKMHAGNYMGTVLGLILLGYLANSMGWRSIFWTSGAIGLFWSIFWWCIVHETPDTDRHISDNERQLIRNTTSHVTSADKSTIPWKQLLISIPIWVFICITFCECYGYYALITLLPKYFKDVFGYDVSQSALLTSLPYVCLTVMMFVTGSLADRFTSSKRRWSLTTFRKFFLLAGFLVQASFMLGAAYWNGIVGNVVCLVMAVSNSSWSLTTMFVLPLDLSPKYASIIYGMALTGGALAGFLGPIGLGYMVSTENPQPREWQMYLLLVAALYLFGCFVLGFFGSAKPLTCDREKQTRIEITN